MRYDRRHEAGLPYRVASVSFRDRSAEHFAHQPFGQVPWLTDGDISIFESSAILLHLGNLSDKLLPADPQQRAAAVSWLFAALNSVEIPSALRHGGLIWRESRDLCRAGVPRAWKNRIMALEIRPNCEGCDRDLPPNSLDARICSFECTFCAECVAKLSNVCPNCGGGFAPRPIRPATEWRAGLSVARRPPSTQRVHLSYPWEAMAEHIARIKDIPPESR